jgi:glycine hydroxymethyltransferase
MLDNPLQTLIERKGAALSPGLAAYVAALQELSSGGAAVGRDIAASIVRELEKQRSAVKLIASENYSSLATQLAMGNLLTDKYAEGFPGHRYYAGNDNVDRIESACRDAACALFGAEHANVQPHCGADANLMAYWAILQTRVESPELARLGKEKLYDLTDAEWRELRGKLGNQKLLGFDYFSGGHLTHGYRLNVSSRMFDVHAYAVDPETRLLDYGAIERQARKLRPLVILAGYSAYPRRIDFKRMRAIADSVGAVLMVDMAHFAGLVAGKVFQGDFSPFPHAHVVTTTTHKTLRGPRGGMVLSTKEFADSLDGGCPLVMGGPLPHVVAAKAVALREAAAPEFAAYAARIVENARALAASCSASGLEVVTGGTDNHLLLVDVSKLGLTGRQAESLLHDCGITLNRNALAFDPNGPWFTSGLRIGTPAATTLGMGAPEMAELGSVMGAVLKAARPAATKEGKPSRAKAVVDEAVRAEARRRVKAVMDRFPVYPELDLEFLKEAFL